MDVVLIAGTVPTLRPFFTKYFVNHKSSRYDRKAFGQRSDDQTILTSSTVPPGSAVANVGGKNHRGGLDVDLDSTDAFPREVGVGNIMMTTRIDVYNDR